MPAFARAKSNALTNVLPSLFPDTILMFIFVIQNLYLAYLYNFNFFVCVEHGYPVEKIEKSKVLYIVKIKYLYK